MKARYPSVLSQYFGEPIPSWDETRWRLWLWAQRAVHRWKAKASAEDVFSATIEATRQHYSELREIT